MLKMGIEMIFFLKGFEVKTEDGTSIEFLLENGLHIDYNREIRRLL